MAHNTTSASAARVGWVSAGEGRSTSDILWSCFSIFLVCTWRCLHVNVPSVEETKAGFLWWHCLPYGLSRPLLRKWGRKALWMVGVILAPELGVATATHDYLSARWAIVEGARGYRRSRSKFEDCHDEEKGVVVVGGGPSKGTLTTTRAFFANMGGPSKERLTISHAFFANMGGFKIRKWRRTAAPTLEAGADNLKEIEKCIECSRYLVAETEAATTQVYEDYVCSFSELSECISFSGVSQ